MRLATLPARRSVVTIARRVNAPARPAPSILCAVDVEAVQVFTSVLALAAAALAVALVVGWFIRGRNETVDGLLVAVGDASLWIAFLVAGVAMAGSLYFSEVADFIPCRLCWFQRIAMYPLAAILLIAAIRRDRSVQWYAVPIAALGASVSIYHYLIEWQPDLEVGNACSATGVSCAAFWFREFGFVTLAFMALCGFVAVIALTLIGARVVAERELIATTERLEA
jgi:disulfide bond formation protein DsbB